MTRALGGGLAAAVGVAPAARTEGEERKVELSSGRREALARLPDAPRDRRIVLQEAIGDCQVPNLSTRMLARAFGEKDHG